MGSMILQKYRNFRQPGTLRAAIWSLIVLITLLLGTECVLRFVLGLGNPVLIQSDPACGYLLKPHQDVYRFFAHTRTDGYGMRSDAASEWPAPGALRLLFVGDSITYGTSRVDQSQLFTEILHRELPARLHRPVEVLNASAGAWAIDNELSFVRSRGTFHAQIVVLVLNSGDLSQPRSTISQVGEGLPSRRESTALGELYTRYLTPKIFHRKVKTDSGDLADYNAEETVRSNLADLDQFRALVSAHGAQMVLVYTPFQIDVPGGRHWAEILRGWSTTHQVPLLDLSPFQAPYPFRQITLDKGIHFNAQGHRVVADAIEQLWYGAVRSP